VLTGLLPYILQYIAAFLPNTLIFKANLEAWC